VLIPVLLRERLGKADMFKTNQMWGSWVPVIAKVRFRKPLLVRCGLEWYRNILRNETVGWKRACRRILGFLLEMIAYAAADRIVITNKTDNRFIARLFPFVRGKVKVVRNYVDESFFCHACGKGVTKHQSDRILFVGRLTRQKNIQCLLRAVKGTGFGLDIVGEGKEMTRLREIVNRDNLDVRFLGLLPNKNLAELMGQYPVFVLPSLFENNPKVLMEAMACGLAVIGSNAQGILELIDHGVNGLVSENDPGSFRRAIKRVVSDKRLQNSLGTQARQTALSCFGLDVAIKEEVAICKELIWSPN